VSLTLEQTAELHDLLWRLRTETASPDELTRLEQWVCENQEVRAFYVRYLHLCADLHWNNAERATEDAPAADEMVIGSNAQGLVLNQSQIPAQQSPGIPAVDVNAPLPISIVLDPSPLPTSSPLFTAYPVLTSNLIAVVLMCIGLLGAWAYQIDVPRPIAVGNLPTANHGDSIASCMAKDHIEYIGKITDMIDATWSDPTTAPVTDRVTLGHKYALASGLMEITYDTGAKVILQGPCVYQADSRDGGFLSVGKLTATLEKEKSEVRSQGSAKVTCETNRKSQITKSQITKSQISNPQSLIPNPSFAVRTPTATVTDLGTEFGVEVDKHGNTSSHVFRGKVEVSILTAEGEKCDSVRLMENQSVRVEQGKGIPSLTRVTSAKTTGFARLMPNRVPIKFFNTGAGLRVGESDPHWLAASRNGVIHFESHPAQVLSIDAWLENDPTKSQWITFKGETPNNAEYTFRTTFDLTGMYPRTAYVEGWFLADNRVSAVRINGKSIKVYPHGWNNFTMFSRFQITSGFVEGVNTLEIDVHNGEPEEGDGPGLMGLRVELNGTAREK